MKKVKLPRKLKNRKSATELWNEAHRVEGLEDMINQINPDVLKKYGAIREFETGATRDKIDGKLCYEGFISPEVMKIFGEFMHKHRTQSDGTLRDPDNWQKGIPISSYQDSLIRHVFDAWLVWRTTNDLKILKNLLCAILFNAQGYLFELRKLEEDSVVYR